MKFILCSFLFLLTYNVAGQNYSFIKYAASEGLPQSQIIDISQDNQGYIWVGTLGGLAKFNGERFESYGTENGLFNNRVSLIEIIDNKLYIGHEGGISISDNDKFINYPLPDQAVNTKVTAILKKDGKILISTNGGGLFKLENSKLVKIAISPIYIRDLIVYQDELYLASREGLFILEASLNLDTLIYDESISFSGFAKGNDKLYISAYNGKIYEVNNQKISVAFTSNHKFRGLLLANNFFWSPMPTGAIKINLNTNSTAIFNESNGLETPDINTVYQDRENNIWLGSNGKGLLRFSGEAFTYFKKNERMASDVVMSILETKSGEYYFSGYGQLTNWVSDTTTLTFPMTKGFIWASIERENGDLFFGTNRGVFWYDADIKHWSVNRKKSQLASAKTTALYELEDKSAVLVGNRDGISRIIGDSIFVDSCLLEKNLTVKGFTEVNNKIFVLGANKLYKLEQEKATKLYESNDFQFTSICKDRNESIWLGSEQGLYNYKEGEIEELKLDKKRGAKFIFFLKAYKEHLYIGTNNGLYKYNTTTKEIVHYGINEGLIDLETNLNSVYLDSKKQLWFGTASGLMRLNINKENSIFTSEKPIVQIAEVLLTKTEKLLSHFSDSITPQGLPVNLELPYKLNGLNIKLDGLYYSNPKSIEFSYAFSTGDSLEWTKYDEAATINFPNLNFGEYTLMVKAKSSNGQESEVKEFNFKILRPYYFTTWFISIIIVLFLALLFASLYFNNIRIKKKIARKQYEEQLKSRTKLARLEQQSLNASMNRHFIFNSLNSIQYYINANDKLSANKFLTRFAKLIRKNLDSSHEKNGLVKLTDEIERLKLYLDLERMRFTNKFDYSIDIENGIDLDSIDVPAMLLQPFVENSIIHGVLPRHDDKGQIGITITKQKDSFVVQISDNGVGIDESKINKVELEGDHNSHGMEITSKRIEILKKLTERNIELKGPSQINESDGKIKGTSVWIRIDNKNLPIRD